MISPYLLSAIVTFMPMPVYDTPAYCNYMENHPSEVVRKYITTDCSELENKTRTDAGIWWPTHDPSFGSNVPLLAKATQKNVRPGTGVGSRPIIYLLTIGSRQMEISTGCQNNA